VINKPDRDQHPTAVAPRASHSVNVQPSVLIVDDHGEFLASAHQSGMS
jgi:hypothetical protein